MKTIIITGTPGTQNEIMTKQLTLNDKNSIVILFPEIWTDNFSNVALHPEEMIKELEKRYDKAYKKDKDIILVTYSCIAVNSLRIFIAKHDLDDNKFYQIIKDDSGNITIEVISIDNNGKFQTKLHNKGILNSLSGQLFKLLEF